MTCRDGQPGPNPALVEAELIVKAELIGKGAAFGRCTAGEA
jgi:hypothetical protein